MKPVAIFRHAPTEGPGYLADFLDVHGIPWQLIRIDAGDSLPESVESCSGLVFMGGPMSVNDPLPWIAPLLALIRSAVAVDIPVLGHCLGGQLISKALGGTVGSNPVKEIGWGALSVADNTEARRWFGDTGHFLGFHWHGETFTLPVGAIGILSSAYCANQAFSLGKHLGFQCHIEMTETMVREWCAIGKDEISAAHQSPGVMRLDEIEHALAQRVAALNAVAKGIYSQWIAGLAK